MARPVLELDNDDPGVVDVRQVRAMAFAPAREQIIDQVMRDRSLDRGGRAVVVGSGYSPLPQALADKGFDVASIDPSAIATAIADRRYPEIDHSTAPATALPLADGTVDLGFVVDTLETTDDLSAPLAELARVLRPGGVAIFDTVTDSVVARAVYLGAFQRLGVTKIVSTPRYRRDRLRHPTALGAAAADHGLDIDRVVGFAPRSAPALIRALLKRRAGSITDADLSDACGFHLEKPGKAPLVTYFAVAIKRA